MKSDFKIILQYLLFSGGFLGLSFLIAYYFWWRIDLESAEFFIIVISAMISWIGIGYLSILLAGKIIFRGVQEIGFVSPFTLIIKGFFYERIGLRLATKFKKIFSIIAFPMFIFFIFLFYKIVHFVEINDLMYYPVEKLAKIEKISYYKGFKRGQIVFRFDNKEIKKVIYLNDTMKNVGDYEEVIFSFRNPYILKSKIDFGENFR